MLSENLASFIKPKIQSPLNDRIVQFIDCPCRKLAWILLFHFPMSCFLKNNYVVRRSHDNSHFIEAGAPIFLSGKTRHNEKHPDPYGLLR
jgi:hypothetical protein